MLTVDLAHEWFEYDPSTGLIRWKKQSARNVPVGREAGSRDKLGYLHIRFKGRAYLAHRVAWLMTFGEWPPEFTDHIDGNPSNNRISNLRLASPAQNRWNSREFRSGMTGVSPSAGGRTCIARIQSGKKKVHLGTFGTEQEANMAYQKAASKLFGDYARTN